MLHYNISAQLLHGAIDGKPFAFTAYAGGGRGSKHAGVVRKDLAHWSSDKKAPDAYLVTNRGGPLPSGMYKVAYRATHQKFGECAYLAPTLTALLRADRFAPAGVRVTDRDRFYIHKRGPRGSDGCIVPHDDADLRRLIAAVRVAREPVYLRAYSEGLDGDALNAAAALARTA